MSFVSRLRGKGPSGFGASSTAEEVARGLDLSGKCYLVTGVTSGIGGETLRVLMLQGANVVGTGRTLAAATSACAPLGARARPAVCDLSEPASVHTLAAELLARGQQLDGIVCNAGVMALPKLTIKHGVELQFLTNHLGHFLLVTGILPLLAPGARVVVVSSDAHRAAPRKGIDFDNLDGRKGYQTWGFYGQSKLANLLFAKELARRLDDGKTSNAVHPGVIITKLQRTLPTFMTAAMSLSQSIFLKTIPEGAATSVFAAVHPSLAAVSGEYLADCNVKAPRRVARDPELAARLWEYSEKFAAGFSRP